MTNGVKEYTEAYNESASDREMFKGDKSAAILDKISRKIAKQIVSDLEIDETPIGGTQLIKHRVSLLTITPERLSELLEIERYHKRTIENSGYDQMSGQLPVSNNLHK